jgi:hypothetical protein
MERALDLLVDEFDSQFDKCLPLAWNSGCRAAHYPSQEAEADDSGQQSHYKRIDVQRPERTVSYRTGQVRQVMGHI